MTPYYYYYYDHVSITCAHLTMHYKIPGNIALLAAQRSTSTSNALQWLTIHYPELLL